MTTRVYFSVIEYEKNVISVIPIDYEGYNEIQHMIPSEVLTDKELNKVFSVCESNGGWCVNLGLSDARFYTKHLEQIKLDKIFTHKIISKTLTF